MLLLVFFCISISLFRLAVLRKKIISSCDFSKCCVRWSTKYACHLNRMHPKPEQVVRLFWVPSGDRLRWTRHREPNRSAQCSGPGVRGVEGLKGFSASVSPASSNSLHFSPREAVEKNYSHCSPLPENPLVAMDPAVEGLALNYPPVEDQTLHWSPSGQRTAPNRSHASG